MNILHVVDQISQKTAGGSARCPYQLSAAQVKLGHQATIYTTDYMADGQEPPPGVKLVKFKNVNLGRGMNVPPSLIFGDFLDFDIMHLHNYRTPINLIAASHGKPFVLEAHGNAAPIIGHRLGLAIDWTFKHTVMRKASCCIANAEIEIEHYVKAGNKKVVLIPPGIDLEEFEVKPGTNQTRYKTILSLGRLDYNKGVDILIDAFALLKREDVVLKIAGVDYGYQDVLRGKVERHHLLDRVRFIGPLYGRAKAEAYRDADLFVMPSRSEIWGLTFMEALAMGTPVLMTEGCGSSSALPVKCGRVVPASPYRMAAEINDMLNEGLASYSRDYRREWVSQFSWDLIAQKTIKLYREVLTDRCLAR